jgi:predicted nucleic acid-binding protein
LLRVPRSLTWRRVFVDSGADLAALDRRDINRDEAVLIFRQLANQGIRLYTSNTILIESHALIMSTLGVQLGVAFLQTMERSNTTIARVRAADEVAAKQVIYRFADKDFSFADAISLVVMQRLGIERAVTFDRHFSQYGLTAVTTSTN